ncbi:hypothetical protein CA85_51930 [Allorhodopirellula solitaria]|uniref:Uncharacterized protein n=1 Tax=Allorhodopirellula solitaria TaxID=2527987 RepID=A0A5C5WLW4_9BACT|nr:hypothetical protein CA85_51930 [Allorhodopirellula solitaria]
MLDWSWREKRSRALQRCWLGKGYLGRWYANGVAGPCRTFVRQGRILVRLLDTRAMPRKTYPLCSAHASVG